jgi:uncharacterized protein YraI
MKTDTRFVDIMKQMRNSLLWIVLVLLLTTGVSLAQEATGRVTTRLNVRDTPSTRGGVITQFALDAVVIIEARDDQTNWLLVHLPDNTVRGWVSRQYIDVGVLNTDTLPVSQEQINAPAPQENAAAPSAPASVSATALVHGVNLVVRLSPSTRADKLGVVSAGTTVALLGRSEASDWAYVSDGVLTGWVARRYLRPSAGVVFANLPVMSGIGQPLAVAVPTGPIAAPVPNQPPAQPVGADSNYILLTSAAIEKARVTFQRGRSLGNSPNTFIKIGDSNMLWAEYLCPFNNGSYDLGSYSHLQGIVSTFAASGSFCQNNTTAHEGFTSAAVLDAFFVTDPNCRTDEIPLSCEIRLRRPSYALIYIGVLDMNYLPAEAFQSNITNMIIYLQEKGVVPILFTFTIDDWRHDGRAVFYNDAIRHVAQRQDLPLVDIQAALYNYPARGTATDGFHLAARVKDFISFTGDENTYGRTKRELLTLEVLNRLHWTISQ